MSRVASFLISFVIVIAILVVGKSMFIPLIFAALIWLIMRQIRLTMDRLPLIKKFVPKWIKTLISTAILVVIVAFIGKLVTESIQVLIDHYPFYEAQIQESLGYWDKMSPYSLSSAAEHLSAKMVNGTYLPVLLTTVQTILSSVGIVLTYMLFILLEESSFQPKLALIFPDKDKYTTQIKVIQEITHAITHYIGIKSAIAASTATLSYIVFASLGLDAAFFWALLVFLFNFIPFIGVFVSTLLPTAFAVFQFNAQTEPLIILFGVGGLQFLMGNLIEPKIMGKSMNVSPLVVILALGIWGMIWGIPGMFLSVPITVIMVIILSKFKATRAIAIALSEKGELQA